MSAPPERAAARAGRGRQCAHRAVRCTDETGRCARRRCPVAVRSLTSRSSCSSSPRTNGLARGAGARSRRRRRRPRAPFPPSSSAFALCARIDPVLRRVGLVAGAASSTSATYARRASAACRRSRGPTRGSSIAPPPRSRAQRSRRDQHERHDDGDDRAPRMGANGRKLRDTPHAQVTTSIGAHAGHEVAGHVAEDSYLPGRAVRCRSRTAPDSAGSRPPAVTGELLLADRHAVGAQRQAALWNPDDDELVPVGPRLSTRKTTEPAAIRRGDSEIAKSRSVTPITGVAALEPPCAPAQPAAVERDEADRRARRRRERNRAAGNMATTSTSVARPIALSKQEDMRSATVLVWWSASRQLI